MSWNVQGEIGIGEVRLQRQLDFLDEHTADVDLFLFQAVHYEPEPMDNGHGQLGALLDYFANRAYHVVHTGDWAHELAESNVQPHADIEGTHNRCNVIASRWPIERRPLTLGNHGDRKPRQLDYYYSHFPEKMLVAEIDVSNEPAIPANTVETWNVGIINGANWGEEKLNMLETVYGRIYLQTTKTETPVLLGGDFNAPKRETADGEIIPHGNTAGQYTNYPYYGDPYYLRDSPDELQEFRFNQRWQLAEARLFDSDVSQWGMRDAYWAAESSRQESSTEDYTHIVHSGTPSKKRLDHVLVSQQFDVDRCTLWNGEGTSISGLDSSDHAPVVAELKMG
jgi:endonuclease/exonuclease/phosphatase family metal-dependent hydrolase